MSSDRSGGNIIRKVLLAFALGSGAVAIAFFVSYFSLNQMLTVVYDLGTPNEKLKTLNNLYRKTTALNDQQRIDAIRKPEKPVHDFLEESNELLMIVDSLMDMRWADTVQTSRLQQMQSILQQRNKLFLAYLKIRSNVTKDRVMARKFDTLTEMLSKNNVAADTSVRTSQKKSTTITYLRDTTTADNQKRSFFTKIFRKRKVPTTAIPEKEVREEVEVTVDTISIAMSNTNLAAATRLIDELGANEITMRKKLAARELALLATTRELFRQLIDIVHLVEAEELEHIRVNNEAAINVVDESSKIIVAILLVLSFMAAILIYLIVIDVTRSNYFRRSLIREKERAEELSVVKERFLSNMSHEIRTPLQAIIGYSEQLRSNPAANTEAGIRAIGSSSEHLLHIVNEVLDYSRLESGKIEFEKKDFYLLETIEEAVSTMNVQAQTKGLNLYFETAGASNDLVEGDQFRLRQVLYNLLGNAIKFTSHGAVTLTVSNTHGVENVNVIMKVTDTGIGIKASEIDHIFNRFEQANKSIGNLYGGTGLGLTIVKMIVDGQGGRINVESTEGHGSVFTVRLSYKRKAIESKLLSLPKVSINVLVLDDDKLIVDLCGLIFTSAGIPFQVHPDPEELFSAAIDPSITHILMDIRLGNVDGTELCRSLRKRVGANVKIIAMTAGANTKTFINALVDFDEILKKPFRASQLYELLGISDTRTSVIEPIDSDQFSIVRSMTNHDEELFRSVLSDFVGETKQDILMLERAIDEQQNEKMLVLVHKLSGRINQFGFGSLSFALSQIEHDLEAGQTAAMLKQRWSDLKQRIQLMLSHL